MPTANDLPEVLETTEPERLATGFIFTEGPLWHPDGYWYFVDLRRNQLLRLTPGKEPELVRTTIGGNGTTFDLLACISHSRWRIVGEMAQCAAGESRAVVDTKGEYRRGHRDCVERVIIFDASARISGSWR